MSTLALQLGEFGTAVYEGMSEGLLSQSLQELFCELVCDVESEPVDMSLPYASFSKCDFMNPKFDRQGSRLAQLH